MVNCVVFIKHRFFVFYIMLNIYNKIKFKMFDFKLYHFLIKLVFVPYYTVYRYILFHTILYNILSFAVVLSDFCITSFVFQYKTCYILAKSLFICMLFVKIMHYYVNNLFGIKVSCFFHFLKQTLGTFLSSIFW